jgi:hypothetical protein
VAVCLALFAMATSIASRISSDTGRTPEHYLLLVNTAIAFMMDESKFRQFEQSPYNGLAVAFLHAYDTSPVPPASSMTAQIRTWRGFTSKDIWPWVYINRMIAASSDEKNAHSDTPYFHAIAGADLDDARGARSDFLQIWRNSLATARESKAPGVVFDPEFYNYYREYDIGELAKRTSRTPAQVAENFRGLGAQMADIAAQEYPKAVLWLFWTGFSRPAYKTYDGVGYYPSPTYIAIGLLEEISQKRMHLKVLSGGEVGLSYCHDTLEDLRTAIEDRQRAFDSTLEKYRGILELAGTMTVWSDRPQNNVCKTATAASVEQLQPYLELLLKSYRYNWIWGSADGNYLAFSPAGAPRFDTMIRGALANSN